MCETVVAQPYPRVGSEHPMLFYFLYIHGRQGPPARSTAAHQNSTEDLSFTYCDSLDSSLIGCEVHNIIGEFY